MDDFELKLKSYSKRVFFSKMYLTVSIRFMFGRMVENHNKFPLRISSVNLTKSAENCGFNQIY